MNLIKHLWIGIFILFGLILHAQNPDLEFTQGSRGAANGPALNSGAFTFFKNTNNPTGNTYAAYTPALTATFVISNPQVTSGTGISTVTNSPVNFGYLGNSATGIIARMSSAGAPVDTYYTSSGATTAGTGMAAASTYTLAQSNFIVSVNQSVGYLVGTDPAATNYQADMTITFNRPVNNPIIHIGGFGGIGGSTGFSALYQLDSFVASSGSLTFSKLSGTTSLSVVGNTFGNSSTTINTSGNDSGSGSVLITGNGITSLKFKVLVRGDGRGAGTTSWTGGNANTADGYTLGLTLLESDLQVTQSASTLTPDYCNNMTFTVNAANNGASNSPNTVVNAAIPSGYNYVSHTASAGTYDSSTGVWTLGTLNDASTATLTITVKAKTTGTYAFSSSISGDNSDPDPANNSATTSPVPIPFMDSDGDGVTDTCDLDNDNDGIPDAIENANDCAFKVQEKVTNGNFSANGTNWNSSNIIFNGTNANFGNNAQGAVGVSQGSFSQALSGINSSSSVTVTFDLQIQNDTGRTGMEVSLGGVKFIYIQNRGQNGVGNIANDVTLFNGATTNLATTGGLPGYTTFPVTITIPYSAFNTATPTLLFEFFNCGGCAATYGDFVIDNVSVGFCDQDGDGIPNFQDTDSDGDGCWDAIEGDAAFTTANLGANNRLSGAVDSNGIPTQAGTGQSAGSAYNNAVRDDACVCISGQPNFSDTDGDGIGNFCDLDDDNDGILDTNECGATQRVVNGDFSTLSGTTGSKTPAQFSTITSNAWLLTNSTTGSGNIYFVQGNVIQFFDENATQTMVQELSQTVNNVKYTGDGTKPQITITNFASRNGNGGSVPAEFGKAATFIVMYDGIEYARVVTSNGTGTSATVSYSNGATGTLTSVAVGTVYSTWIITLPTSVVNSGVLKMRYEAQPFGNGSGDDFEIRSIGITSCIDTDNDGIPNTLDLDSDNDGCLDAIEGGANITASQLVTSAGTVSVGTGSTASNQNLCAANTCVNSNGIPQLSPLPTGYSNTTGQTVGGSSDGTPSADCITVCYESPTDTVSSVPVKHGITLLGRAGADNGNWPMLRNSAYTVLESKTKGLVITRNSNPEVSIAIPVVGMMVFDTDENSGKGCLKIYTGAGSGEGWKCFNTQTCP
ncbi:hypothetical protein [Chryseobacterium sp.]|uniref:hypothetical protein n=1 Tax=Chryseobacterium sp. TaxID=1871047 RepID=UPI0035C70E22